MAATPLSSIRADIARLEANIQAFTNKIGQLEQVQSRSEAQFRDLDAWRLKLMEYEACLKEARAQERQELLRIEELEREIARTGTI